MSYPTYKTEGIIGFAENRVTGGWDGYIVEVNNLNELKENVKDNLPKVIVINSNISVNNLTKIELGANKSIIGSWNNHILNNIHFRTTVNSKNIIFQNLIFQHSENINGNDDIQIYLTNGNKYWIDHITFTGHSWSDNDNSLDKLIYIGENADYITISNSLFQNHKYGLIFGYPDDNNTIYDGYPHLTICHNYFENIEVRSPGLMRYGYFHSYNNYINNFTLGYTLATNGKIISENNYFDKGSEKNGMLDDKGNGTFTDNGSLPQIKNQISPQSNWTADSNYSYKLVSVNTVKSFNTQYAGAQNNILVFGS